MKVATARQMAELDRVTIEQYDPRKDEVVKIVMSMAQVRELAAALNLPEGVYRLTPKK